jgi:hypothetical protein
MDIRATRDQVPASVGLGIEIGLKCVYKERTRESKLDLPFQKDIN